MYIKLDAKSEFEVISEKREFENLEPWLPNPHTSVLLRDTHFNVSFGVTVTPKAENQEAGTYSCYEARKAHYTGISNLIENKDRNGDFLMLQYKVDDKSYIERYFASRDECVRAIIISTPESLLKNWYERLIYLNLISVVDAGYKDAVEVLNYALNFEDPETRIMYLDHVFKLEDVMWGLSWYDRGWLVEKMAMAYLDLGNTEEAKRVIWHAIIEDFSDRSFLHYQLARVYTAEGDKRNALLNLRKSLQMIAIDPAMSYYEMPFAAIDPYMDELKSDEDWLKLMERYDPFRIYHEWRYAPQVDDDWRYYYYPLSGGEVALEPWEIGLDSYEIYTGESINWEYYNENYKLAVDYTGGRFHYSEDTGPMYEARFDNVNYFTKDNIAQVYVDGGIAYINTEGERINEEIYLYGSDFYEGFAFVTDQDWNQFYIDTNGDMLDEVILEDEWFDQVDSGEGDLADFFENVTPTDESIVIEFY